MDRQQMLEAEEHHRRVGNEIIDILKANGDPATSLITLANVCGHMICGVQNVNPDVSDEVYKFFIGIVNDTIRSNKAMSEPQDGKSTH